MRHFTSNDITARRLEVTLHLVLWSSDNEAGRGVCCDWL